MVFFSSSSFFKFFLCIRCFWSCSSTITQHQFKPFHSFLFSFPFSLTQLSLSEPETTEHHRKIRFHFVCPDLGHLWSIQQNFLLFSCTSFVNVFNFASSARCPGSSFVSCFSDSISPKRWPQPRPADRVSRTPHSNHGQSDRRKHRAFDNALNLIFVFISSSSGSGLHILHFCLALCSFTRFFLFIFSYFDWALLKPNHYTWMCILLNLSRPIQYDQFNYLFLFWTHIWYELFLAISLLTFI